MNIELCKNYVQRLNIDSMDTEVVVKKSMELYPELKLKQCHLNDQAKMILCIDCAATSLNIGINIDEASKLSGLNKMKYTKQKDMYENHLGLRKKLTLHGICAQLELSEAIKKGADQLLKEYKKSHECVEDVNENPQYLAMAIYQSCRIRKFKQSSVKQSLIQVSRLNTKMWKELEEQWTKWMNGLPSVKSVGKENVQTAEQDVDRNASENNVQIENEIQSYDEWRDMMIEKAENALKKKR